MNQNKAIGNKKIDAIMPAQKNIIILGKASLVTYGTQGRNHEPFRGTRVG